MNDSKLVGLFQPSNRNNHTKIVYRLERCDGRFPFFIIHADCRLPVSEDELRTWRRHITDKDWDAGVRSHLDVMEGNVE